MKLETDENTYWLALWFGIVVTLATLIGFCTWQVQTTTRKALESGYIEKQKTGGEGTIWVKE